MSLEVLAKRFEKLVCMRVKVLYTRYLEQGKEIYADIVRDTFPECFKSEEEKG